MGDADSEFTDRMGRTGGIRFRQDVRRRWKCMIFGSSTERRKAKKMLLGDGSASKVLHLPYSDL